MILSKMRKINCHFYDLIVFLSFKQLLNVSHRAQVSSFKLWRFEFLEIHVLSFRVSSFGDSHFLFPTSLPFSGWIFSSPGAQTIRYRRSRELLLLFIEFDYIILVLIGRAGMCDPVLLKEI